jgi:hypothetical protein
MANGVHNASQKWHITSSSLSTLKKRQIASVHDCSCTITTMFCSALRDTQPTAPAIDFPDEVWVRIGAFADCLAQLEHLTPSLHRRQ